MSYQLWDEYAQTLLDKWVLNVSTELISRKRFSDVSELMLVVNDFESFLNVSCFAEDKASDWLAQCTSSLSSSLSQLEWDQNTTNQHVYQIMKDISKFIELNELRSMALSNFNEHPVTIKIPDHQQYPITLDW